jgi:indolepyruvate decarboxylase
LNDVALPEFLRALAPKLRRNDTSLTAFRRIREEAVVPKPGPADAPLTTRPLFARVQRMLDAKSCVIAETGDSWFNGMRLDLPSGGRDCSKTLLEWSGHVARNNGRPLRVV